MVLIKKRGKGFYPSPSHLKPFNKMLLRVSSLNSVLSRMYSSEKPSSFLGRLCFSKPTACNLIASGESAIETTHRYNDSSGGIPKKAACASISSLSLNLWAVLSWISPRWIRFTDLSGVANCSIQYFTRPIIKTGHRSHLRFHRHKAWLGWKRLYPHRENSRF